MRGADGRALDAQIEAALCDPGRCLRGLLSGPRPALARAWRAGADAALLGSVWRERGGRVLSLALFTGAAGPARTWVLPVEADGRLSAERLAALARALDEALGERSPPPAQAPPIAAPPLPGPPVPAPSQAREPPEVAREVRVEPPVGPGGRARSGTTGPEAPPAVRRLAGRSQPGGPVALEAGVEAARRSLTFPSGGTAPVGYAVSLPAVPLLSLEFFPLRPAGGRLAGLALLGEGRWLPGIRLPSGDRTHEATFLSLRAGLRWRLPIADRLALAPALAWERTSFVVAPASGARVPGLPDDRRAGPSAALDVEVPLAGSSERPRLALLGALRAAWWLDAGELAGGAAFFPGGRAWTLAAEAGAALRIGGAWSLRCSAAWDTTRWSLDGDPSGAYTVGAARADSLGGRLSVRFDP